MKFFVYCKDHSNEKIYLDFGDNKILSKNDICYDNFKVKCKTTKKEYIYNINEISAEPGVQLSGVFVGAFLFVIDPILGFIDLFKKIFKMNKKELILVKNFNQKNNKKHTLNNFNI